MNDKTIEYYNFHAEQFIQSTINVDASPLYAMFLKYVKPGGAILDLGCGSGRDSQYFKGMGFSVHAIDASESMCDYASTLIGQTVECKRFDDIAFANEFDGVWACSSLLHVPPNELPGILHKVLKSLRSNGILYMSFKYGILSEERSGRFFTDMNENKLMSLLEPFDGITILEMKTTSDVRPNRENEKWLNAVIKKI